MVEWLARLHQKLCGICMPPEVPGCLQVLGVSFSDCPKTAGIDSSTAGVGIKQFTKWMDGYKIRIVCNPKNRDTTATTHDG